MAWPHESVKQNSMNSTGSLRARDRRRTMASASDGESPRTNRVWGKDFMTVALQNHRAHRDRCRESTRETSRYDERMGFAREGRDITNLRNEWTKVK